MIGCFQNKKGKLGTDDKVKPTAPGQSKSRAMNLQDGPSVTAKHTGRLQDTDIRPQQASPD